MVSANPTRRSLPRATGAAPGLYDPRFDHDGCGVGFVARTSGRPDHEILAMALEAAHRLTHRGAVAADGKSGDGAGVLTGIPRALWRREAARHGWRLDVRERFGVGVLFQRDEPGAARRALEHAVAGQGLHPIGWREVPVDPEALGASARSALPAIAQLLIGAPGLDEDEFEGRLYRARKEFERSGTPGYVSSLSCRTIVYKSLCAAHQLPRFYADLRDPAYRTAFAVFHQRYSTNTLPAWRLAQPFRTLGHNGEINTLWANRAWMRAREPDLPPAVRPVIDEAGSDSASLDETLELLMRNGRDLLHALSLLVVPAWEEGGRGLEGPVAAFHRYYGPVMEPWDGPAALAFADGRYVGAALDRNGLRPCRYQVTADGLIVAASETGVLDLDPEGVVERGRLGPGGIIAVDLERGELLRDASIRGRLAAAAPYERWTGARPAPAAADEPDGRALEAGDELTRVQHAYGFTGEDLRLVIGPMVEEGKPATWSMGDDTPIAPLARAPRSLYAFFRQRFAQVTNPAIDPLREESVMSLRTWLGARPPLFSDGPQPPILELDSPVLTAARLAAIRRQRDLAVAPIDCLFAPTAGGLRAALKGIVREAEAAVRAGAVLLVLSDRGADAGRAPIPMALAVGGVHHALLRAGLRTRADLVVEAGDCREDHHLAVLVGYGAGAVCPWLALATAGAGAADLVKALDFGLRKILSKMGISTVASYRAGQLFETLGLADEVVDLCFTGTPNRIGGLGFAELEAASIQTHRAAFAGDGSLPTKSRLPDHGWIRYRRGGDKEAHAWAPPVVRVLQSAVGFGQDGAPDRETESAEMASPDAWSEFQRLAAADGPAQLRDLLDFVAAGPSLALDEVEPAGAIVRRFISSPMSLGALGPEAHRTLAIAMNRLGARSNTGEGGEDPALYRRVEGGERADSKVKQVASGRFGVTTEYLVRAEELEIKIAQGSKPGEGGQLPGHKVTDLIARLRHAQPGVPLISPPPHHDIYSIEDLAQLIYDLKRCNPRARVGVKLVAEAGVGTIAAGVAKAYADYVFICGHSGGTGASPLASIKYAGAPWELGLAETRQVLMRNGLRGRIRVRVDGGLMTARDVVVAALLGAEEFGFGTAPLVAMGCDMARQCHLNTCPAGIATQDPERRARFRGTADHVVRYFLRLAESVRELLALLGLRSLDEAVGRADLLRQVAFPARLDLSALLVDIDGDARRCVTDRNDRPEETEPIDELLVGPMLAALERGERFRATLPIRNRDRSVGARPAGALVEWRASRSPHAGRQEPGEGGGNGSDPESDRVEVELHFRGVAGQSFGAFVTRGLRLILDGEANDYVGKGLSGGELVLRPVGAAARHPERNVILGNVALYGATAGRLFAAGRAGERFAIRNSGAVAVVEGVGDHGCEYMTGGRVVVLGEVGFNFGAGMTGGVAYVLDPDGELDARVNPGAVALMRADDRDLEEILLLIQEHATRTGSRHAGAILSGWRSIAGPFWKVVGGGGLNLAGQTAHAVRSIQPARIAGAPGVSVPLRSP